MLITNNNRKELHMGMNKREEYEYAPKQGFVLTHFKIVQNVKRSAEFISEFSEAKLSAMVNPPSSKLPITG
jgi:hypothetical protein